jgi:malonyl-CoA O-methyltransferase
MTSFPVPLVLLHGWGFDQRVWQWLLPDLQQYLEVQTLDLPCLGNSTLCSDDLQQVCEYVLARMPEKSVVLGWSLGGMLATHLALHYPQRLEALVTVGSNLKWVSESGWPGSDPDDFAAFRHNLTMDVDATLKHFCGVVARGDQQEKKLIRQLRSLLTPVSVGQLDRGLSLLNKIDHRKDFANLTVPGLHIFGQQDALVDIEVASRMVELNVAQSVCIMETCGHAPFLSEPASFVRRVMDFVSHHTKRLNKQRIADSFSKAAPVYDHAAVLQKNIGNKLLAGLGEQAPQLIVDAGCGTGRFSDQLRNIFPEATVLGLDLSEGMLRIARQQTKDFIGIRGDAEQLPLETCSVDLLFSNLAIQWCENLPQLFREWQRVLKPGGQILLTTFVEDTLHELRRAWQQVDDQVHVNTFVTAAVLEQVARQNGLEVDLYEQTACVEQYSSVRELAASLKAIGAHNVNRGQPAGLTGRGKLRALECAYEKFRCGDKLPATYQVLFMHLLKPEQELLIQTSEKTQKQTSPAQTRKQTGEDTKELQKGEQQLA